MSSLPLAALGEGRGFTRDPRFGGDAVSPRVPDAETAIDPLVEAYERGFAEGAEASRMELEQDQRDREVARGRIEAAFARLDEESLEILREKLRLTVLALCESAVLPLALDSEGLAARIDRALAMLVRAQDERTVLLHPHDLELLRDRLPEGTHFRSDPSVERGGLRIETEDGGVEDGPSQWRRILAEALGEC